MLALPCLEAPREVPILASSGAQWYQLSVRPHHSGLCFCLHKASPLLCVSSSISHKDTRHWVEGP